MRHRRLSGFFVASVLVTALLVSACDTSALTMPAQTSEQTASAAVDASTEMVDATQAEENAPSTGAQGGVDIDAIFPEDDGKQIALMNCTGCHSFVPLVIVGFNPEEWHRNSLDHRERVSGLSDEEYEVLYAYLTEYFGPDDPVPELPEVLLEQWTSY